MATLLLLDADVVIDLLRGHIAARAWLSSHGSNDLPYVSGIAAGKSADSKSGQVEMRLAIEQTHCISLVTFMQRF